MDQDEGDLGVEKGDILLRFQSITGIEDIEDCLARLKRKNWNLQTAVEEALMIGESSNSGGNQSSSHRQSQNESQTQSPNQPSASSSSETLAHPTSPSTNTNPANRNMVNNAAPRPSLLRMFTMPLFWGFKFFWAIFSFAVSILPFGRYYRRVRGSSNPTEAAKEFRAKFQSKYGEKSPRFHEASYSQALDKAKQNLQYLLVVLQSDGHDDTDVFNRTTLIADSFLQYVSEKNILVWGGNIKESEAFKVASTLGATRYPFMALIAYHDSLMKVVHRFEGICPPEECIDVFTRIANQLDPTYVAIRAERANRDAERSLRDQQDAAYQHSLKADREKAERVRLEREAKEKEAKQAEQKLLDIERRKELKKQRKLDLIASFPAEPDSSVEFVTRMNIRLPSGARVIRKFDAKSTLQSLYDFVETNDLSPIDLLSDFVIVNTYPRKEYKDKTLTFQAAGLFPNATVLVEEE